MARHIILVLIAALALAACDGGNGGETTGAPDAARQAEVAAAAPQDTPAGEGVTVVGRGRVTGEPDTLRADVGVHVVRDSVDAAFSDGAEAADQVISALREAGVAEEDIQTRELTVRPQRRHRNNQPPQITGYVVRNIVEVAIHEIDQAGEILAAVAEAAGDAARVQRVRFALDENSQQLQAARQRAFEDARTKAEHYAELAGTQLGDLLSVTEVTSQQPPPVPFAAGQATGGAADAPPIMPGEQEVGVSLQATWSLQ